MCYECDPSHLSISNMEPAERGSAVLGHSCTDSEAITFRMKSRLPARDSLSGERRTLFRQGNGEGHISKTTETATSSLDKKLEISDADDEMAYDAAMVLECLKDAGAGSSGDNVDGSLGMKRKRKRREEVRGPVSDNMHSERNAKERMPVHFKAIAERIGTHTVRFTKRPEIYQLYVSHDIVVLCQLFKYTLYTVVCLLLNIDQRMVTPLLRVRYPITTARMF